MSKVIKLTFGPFQENTYIVYDETLECVILDPGCCTERERWQLAHEITQLGLKPVRLLNTHCHIDHIPGNPFVANTYGLGLEIHRQEVEILANAPLFADMFQIEVPEQPPVSAFINEGDEIHFGNTVFKVLFTPGHSPGSICFYNEKEHYVISGDVLFRLSIGRYDLPGADGKTLYESITKKMMTLPDDVTVYSGHGPETTIGYERGHNPFLKRGAFV